jgi:hypothetical protein
VVVDPGQDPGFEEFEEPGLQKYPYRAMSEAVSSLDLFAGYTTVQTLASIGSAVSSESEVLRQRVADIRRSTERSQSLFGGKAAAISQIWALVNECAEPGWNGDGAEPVDRLAAFAAADFIRAVPDGLPLPEAAAEPDGAISLDWILSRNRLFSVSVGTSGRVAFAWLDGSDRGHGVARFDGERVPRPILDGITAIARHGHATIGTR